MLRYLKTENRGASVMAIFICIFTNQLGMVAGTRKSREACFQALRQPCPFCFERGGLWIWKQLLLSPQLL